MLCLKIAGWVANSVDPDEMPHSAASHLGLNCLLRPVCLNTYGKYSNYIFLICCESTHNLWGFFLRKKKSKSWLDRWILTVVRGQVIEFYNSSRAQPLFNCALLGIYAVIMLNTWFVISLEWFNSRLMLSDRTRWDVLWAFIYMYPYNI